jgi:DNA mismatch endonuclease, patch repair protein
LFDTAMADIVNANIRGRMMAGIRSRDTKPEMQVRRALHMRGFRFSRNPVRLPGRPDVVLSRWKVAVFVHGCFWHRHGCSLSKLPANHRSFWESKLAGNVARDEVAAMTLVAFGWRVATVWECALRGKRAMAGFDAAMDRLAAWIRSDSEGAVLDISGDAGC